MMILFSLFLALTITGPIYSQSCSCKDNLTFIIGKIRENYAGYQDKVTPSNKAAFEALIDSLLAAAAGKDQKDLTGCDAIINKYISFFREYRRGRRPNDLLD